MAYFFYLENSRSFFALTRIIPAYGAVAVVVMGNLKKHRRIKMESECLNASWRKNAIFREKLLIRNISVKSMFFIVI